MWCFGKGICCEFVVLRKFGWRCCVLFGLWVGGLKYKYVCVVEFGWVCCVVLLDWWNCRWNVV